MSTRLIPALICALGYTGYTSFAAASDPQEQDIQSAMNDGIQLEDDAAFVKVADVGIKKGGLTARGDYLFICDATLIWTVSREELIEVVKQEADREADAVGFLGEMFKGMATVALKRVTDFDAGDEIQPIRFRVRLERAGDDWIAVESKIVERPRQSLKPADG